ncbi:DEAD/DEAH box helicase [Rhodococcus hoagii]|uniref:helicase C-terminal domain-containing protein n=1 Tax=Rhodococcus hoagii TaxID=43767 RepID=UPI001963C03E|nr:helicase C-terminal domain-containing protein [Prescottella equi]MBM9838701.1 DEAD/DEAH box helicase [Prescottella equi]
MDFGEMLAEQDVPVPVEPRKLYASLGGKSKGYGYLRDVQGQILEEWDRRRAERDLVIKVNTGGGKTIDGLVILQSYLNEGLGPALYVAPSPYLASQVQAEAARVNISTVDDPEHPQYLAGEAIAVVNAWKLFNGRSVFSDKRPSKPPVPIGSVVLDDAHAALAITREALSIHIPVADRAFAELLELFRDDIHTQSPNALLDINEKSAGALARVPFWSWRSKIDSAREILHKHRDTPALRYPWPAVSEVLHLAGVVVTDREISITPYCAPVRHITGFFEAKRRVYLTATLADDSVLVSEFGADPSSVKRAITPGTAGDIGERMILAPQELNPALDLGDVRRQIADLAGKYNVVVIAPSDRAAHLWGELGARVVDADHIAAAVEDLKTSHVGLVAWSNKYDGIDLPEDACRVLVIDGLPEVANGDERVQAQLLRGQGHDDRQVQRIEQGMGRGVRSNEDHCVVFLLGSRLSQLIADPRSFARFGPATREQLKLSRRMAARLRDKPMAEIIDTAKQALSRDPKWVDLATRALASVPAQVGDVSGAAIAQRTAFEKATDGDYRAAADLLDSTATMSENSREKGWLLEQRAHYTDLLNPAAAQTILAESRRLNPSVLRPRTGVVYTPISVSDSQAQRASDYLSSRYPNAAELRLGIQTVVDDLVFDKDRVPEHEAALAVFAKHIGLDGQCPEDEIGEGPDALWAMGDSKFFVIEAKSGSKSQVIHKGDANQLAGSMNWFRERYGELAEATPVIVHRAHRLADDAAATPGMKVLNEDGMGRLKRAAIAFAEGLASERWDRADVVDQLLMGHELRASDLTGYLRSYQPAR